MDEVEQTEEPFLGVLGLVPEERHEHLMARRDSIGLDQSPALDDAAPVVETTHGPDGSSRPGDEKRVVEGYPGIPRRHPPQGPEDSEPHHAILLLQQVALQHVHTLDGRKARDGPGNIAPQLLWERAVTERVLEELEAFSPEGPKRAPRLEPHGLAAQLLEKGREEGRATERPDRAGHGQLDVIVGIDRQRLEDRDEGGNRTALDGKRKGSPHLWRALAEDDLQERARVLRHRSLGKEPDQRSRTHERARVGERPPEDVLVGLE